MTGIEILAMAFLAGCAAKFARDQSDGLGNSDDTGKEEGSGSSYSSSSWRSTLSEIKPLALPVFDPPQARRVIDVDRFDRIDRDSVYVELPPLSSLLLSPQVREIDIDRLCRDRDRPINLPPLSELVAPLRSSEINVDSVSRSDTGELFGRKPLSMGAPRRSKLHSSSSMPAFTPLPKAPDSLAPWKSAIEPIFRPFVEDTPTFKPMPFPPLFPRFFEPTTLPKGPDPFAPWRW